MEIESRNELWNKLKVVFYLLRKTMAKTRLLVDLHLKLKNGKLARKAFTAFLLRHHYAAFACHCTANNVETSFISPQEHASRSIATGSRPTSHHHHPDHDHHKLQQLVLEVSNDGRGGATNEPPPLAVVASPLKAEEENQVDKAAEDFINRFYQQLKQQRITSPSPDHLWAQ